MQCSRPGVGGRLPAIKRRCGAPLKVLLACGLLCACNSSSTSPKERAPQLTLLSSQAVDINEPSGLTGNAAGTVLWVVGNNPESVYRLEGGQVVDTLAYEGDDLEGIVFDPSDSTLWVVEEKRREVVRLNLKGNVLQRRKVALDGDSNNGLEGICIDGAGNLYVLKEKKPGLLIALDADFSTKREYELDFAKDYSGLVYDPQRQRFWVLSHEDGELYLWDNRLGLISSHSLPAAKAEGVTLDGAAERLYVISETDQTLYSYALSAAPD